MKIKNNLTKIYLLRIKEELFNFRKKIVVSLLIVTILAGFFGGTYAVASTLLNSEKFSLKNIVVEGNIHTDKIKLINEISIFQNVNLFDLDIRKIKSRLEKLPWIKTVNIRYVLPNGIKIVINERKAFSVAKISGHNYLIGDDGYIIKEYSDKVKSELIKLSFVKDIDVGFINNDIWSSFKKVKKILKEKQFIGYTPYIYFEKRGMVIRAVSLKTFTNNKKNKIDFIIGNGKLRLKIKRAKELLKIIKSNNIKLFKVKEDRVKEIDLTSDSNGIIKLSEIKGGN